MDRRHEEWTRRVAAEYRSAAITAQVVHWMVVAALPGPLLTEGLRIVQDELDHATLSHDCLLALGAPDTPATLDHATLERSRGSGPTGLLAALVDAVVVEHCLGETLAVPLFAAMRRHATVPAVVAALDRITSDEARHRQFGWDALAALIELDPPGVRAHVAARLPGALADLTSRYAPGGASPPPPTDDERAAGLLGLEDYRRILHSVIRGELPRRFAALSIAYPRPG